MTKKLKRPIAIFVIVAMLLSILLYLPVGVFGGFGIRASAEDDRCICNEPSGSYEPNGDGTHTQLCENCGLLIASGNCETYDENGRCTVCQGECVHKNVVDGICSTCGKVVLSSDITFEAVAGSPEGYKNEGYKKLVDKDTGTKWCCQYSDSAYVIIDATEQITVTGYIISTGNDTGSNPDRNPKSWNLYASNDYTAGSWTLIDTVDDGKLPAANIESKKFTLKTTPDNYRYYKLEITSIVGGSTMQISELAFEYIICEHSWGLEGEIEPTCTEGGYNTYKCSLCGATKKVSNDKPAAGHYWDDEEYYLPTCTEDGYTTKTCFICHEVQKTYTEEKASGHNYVDNICTNCGESNTEPTEPSAINGCISDKHSE